jgi:predicted 2-oxoglutarate/Fe(II)-dependent dioxygenase YbiX
MAAPQRAPVSGGERAADFVAPRGDGRPARFYGHSGGSPSVLVFSGAGGESGAEAVRRRLGLHLADDVDVHLVATGPVEGPEVYDDARGSVHGAYGIDVDGSAKCVVLDPNNRVLTPPTEVADDRAAEHVAATAAGARHLGDPVVVTGQAPVLFVPGALTPDLCADLVELWEAGGNVATGVEATVGEGRAEAADERRKRRRDHVVTDPERQRALATHLGRRLMPEIRKAFGHRVNRFEGFKIACYDAADGGLFTLHRDNLSPSTAHRVYGLSVNLVDDYDGGELRFPEYGPQRYRPGAGEALVFSGSHLHEVVPVTRGRRFVLLSFLSGDEQR